MFEEEAEEEAEEYAKENKEVYGSDEYADITDYNNIKQAFLDGAEFGFDNAKNKMEKHIAELEQINAELKTVKIPQLERKIASIRGVHSVDCKKLNARLEQCERQKERITELEKEKAELREQIEKMRNFQNCDYQLHIVDCPIFKNDGHISCKKCPHWILLEVSE